MRQKMNHTKFEELLLLPPEIKLSISFLELRDYKYISLDLTEFPNIEGLDI